MIAGLNNKVIFWDFDGVIADTFQQVYAIARLVYPDLHETEYRRMFEGNINVAKRTAEPNRDVNFFAELEKTILDAPLTSGIADILQETSTQYTNVIISSNIVPLIDRYLREHNIRDYFVDILDNDIAHSKVEKFNLAFTKHATSDAHSVLVTDTLGDMLEANEVNVPTIGVLWGFQTLETLAKGNPAALVEQPDQLMTEIRKLL